MRAPPCVRELRLGRLLPRQLRCEALLSARSSIRWDEVFTTAVRHPPAAAEQIACLVDDLRRPPSEDEVRTLVARQSNPFPTTDPLHAVYCPVDPRAWRLPSVDLPAAYVSLLQWSDGATVQTGEMEFAFRGTADLRAMMFGYHVPEYMPLTIPLGLDGSGNFALFDVRSPMKNGEYPVLVASAGNLGFEDAALLSPTFEGFCRRTTRVEDALFDGRTVPPPPEAAARWARRERDQAIAQADGAFRAKNFDRVVELLAPHRDSLEGSIESKLRIAEKRRTSQS